VYVPCSHPDEVNRREELGSTALPRGKKKRAGLSGGSHRQRNPQGGLGRWSRRERGLEGIGYTRTDGHALELASELFQPGPGRCLVGEPDDLPPRGPKTVLEGTDGISRARLTQRRRLEGLRK
jgi:hypothetical protein